MLKSLAEVIREKLDAGTLPVDEPVLLWPGNGSGKACSACGHPILQAQTEFVPQWDDDRPIVVFHVGCYGLWQAERHRLRYALAGGSMETNDLPLADKIRRRLDAGELPRERPPKTWVGFGNGETCCACDQKIHPAQVMYEVDSNEKTYRFHAGCHGLWVGALIHRGLYKPE